MALRIIAIGLIIAFWNDLETAWTIEVNCILGLESWWSLFITRYLKFKWGFLELENSLKI